MGEQSKTKPRAKKSKVVELKLRLFSDNIITTSNRLNHTKSGVLLNAGKGELLTRQTVLAAGPASGIEVGEEVELNPTRFPVKKVAPTTRGGYEHGIGKDREILMIPTESIDGVEYLFISTREIKYVYTK